MQRRAPGAKQLKVLLVKPRGHAELEARLVPGRYDLRCSPPGHRDRGMRTVLTVRR